MNRADLLSTTAEIALKLIEKNGVVVPFCRAVTAAGGIVIYSPETHADDENFKKAQEHQRSVVLQEVMIRKLVGLAFCKEILLTMKDPDEEVAAIKIELHYVGTKPSVFYFPCRVEHAKPESLPYQAVDVEPIELWAAT